MNLLKPLGGLLAATSIAACGAPTAPTPAKVAADQSVATAERADTKTSATPTTTAPAPGPKSVAPAPAEVAAAQGAGASLEAAEKYKAWGVVHAFLGGTVVAGRAVSPTEAIAFTKDNHVGITTDGGASWGFIRHASGEVKAVAGAPGGPYVAVGKAGYMAISKDGKSWSDMPRFTEDELVSVAVGQAGIVAVSRGGVWVHFDKAGQSGAADVLPDKFKAQTVVAQDGGFLALAGKNAYLSASGSDWTKLDAPPALPDVKKPLTSRGQCAIARVGKAPGVSCEVKGQAWGISDDEAVVYDKKTVAFTQNGGSTWAVSPAPFAGLVGVVGAAKGPVVAFGQKGAMAITRDGRAWKEVNVNATKTLQAGLFDGSTVLVVGDGGTIVKSADGGETWEVAPSPVTASLKQIVKLNGRYVVPMGKKGLESNDGITWNEMVDTTELEQVAAPAKPGKCEGRMPAAGEVCSVARAITTPLGLPTVRVIDFNGDVGLAMGDNGLVAMTADGGSTWKWNSGFSLRGLSSFDAKGKVVVAVGGASVIVSTDGGATFREAQLPKKAGRVNATYIGPDGTVLAAGANGTILRASGDLSSWELLDTGAKNRTTYIGLYEAAGTVYASGSRGELYRGEAAGTLWIPVATGVKEPIQAVTGEGNTVLAVTYVDRRGGNHILRSDDGGRHFYVLREVSDSGGVGRFELKEGKLFYDERVSNDTGASWTMAGDNYWGGAIDVGDGSGIRIANRASTYTRDRFYVVGAEKDDYTIVDSFYSKGSSFRCDAGTGCWMIQGGQVYRPL
ncbi:MAG: hypothetical protein KC635_02430 [Myxococcales bacterium]|nr:hypothetical protein [Myxococcales bacterium]MCB9731097.1 hypothetical protein [Deltaproteobacteria bacterium]